jgi:hypothetical protein
MGRCTWSVRRVSRHLLDDFGELARQPRGSRWNARVGHRSCPPGGRRARGFCRRARRTRRTARCASADRLRVTGQISACPPPRKASGTGASSGTREVDQRLTSIHRVSAHAGSRPTAYSRSRCSSPAHPSDRSQRGGACSAGVADNWMGMSASSIVSLAESASPSRSAAS